ncbi:hypothetical protein [Hymenobacter sp. YC55]|uniref:hypothetical protein n=1 Tax=Hymenobacter sp. YC55 TaxID=3034019 RepID=UPI0023F6789A|nr:hypothetical protein [Hymenobacter sp. YC55]MDF7810147.1 hypothetical protein [Hymenobacter sp. YC55]
MAEAAEWCGYCSGYASGAAGHQLHHSATAHLPISPLTITPAKDDVRRWTLFFAGVVLGTILLP